MRADTYSAQSAIVRRHRAGGALDAYRVGYGTDPSPVQAARGEMRARCERTTEPRVCRCAQLAPRQAHGSPDHPSS
jgi:DTW domain-containing protein YfiP